MGEVIRNIDFKNKEELSKENIKKEVGDLRVEKADDNGEKQPVKIEANKVRDYLQKEEKISYFRITNCIVKDRLRL